ncbi:hypothetical protein [Pseudomonas sp.]|uniref:hypothetical protein n=1 Tax=Pseudomonas sp. TaxID=306 RepID=UPI003CC5AE89
MNVTKPYRVRDEFVEVIKERRINMIVETREDIGEADLVNAVLWRHLESLTTKDVLKYREEILGKD